MATRMADADALVRRAENVGWQVDRGRNGWKVRTPGGMYAIHRTYSDIRSLTNAAKALERLGLKEAEEAMATARGSSRTLKMAAEVEKAERARQAAAAAAEEATQRAMLARASGPYQNPEDVPLTWYAQEHPSPWMRWVIMTPEIAGYLLDAHNQDNRKLRPATVSHYKNIILSGQWHMTHQGAAMDTRAVLQDGQHRLAAIELAGEEIDDLQLPMAFFVGMSPDNFKAIDEGLLRSAADTFGRGANAESYGSVIGTVARMAMAFEDQNPRRVVRIKTTNEKIFDYFTEDADELRKAAKFGVANYKKCFTTQGPLASAYYLLRKKNGPDNAFVDAFFTGLITGAKAGTRLQLDELDPRSVLRDHFQNVKIKRKRLTGIEALSIIILAWNNVVTGKTPRTVYFTDDSPIPRIVLCADKGPNASACPELLVGEVHTDHDDDEDA